MKWKMRDRRGSVRIIVLGLMLSMLISIQVFSMSSMAAYFGIQLGSEAQVGTDETNDIWQLEVGRYQYIANGQSKPEIDMVGLNVTTGLTGEDSYRLSENVTISSVNMTVDYNHTFSFDIPLVNLLNVTYTFLTNQTYVNSTIEFFNWTSSTFVNQSIVENISKTEIGLDLYNKSTQGHEILININVTHSNNFTLWFNITFEVLYSVDQIISVNYASLTPGNVTLVDNIKTWIFLDTDADDKIDYAILWIYGGEANLYEITSDSFWADGSWTGQLKKFWTGIEWTLSTSKPTKDIGNLTANRLNVTIPSFLVNLTAAVRYSVWSLKMESQYHWWDALPDDPNWQISLGIPAFQFIYLGLGLALIGLIFILKIKKPPQQNTVIIR